MHPWHIALFAFTAALAVAAFISECALCRRERSDRSLEND
jgi:hypothetical protein